MKRIGGWMHENRCCMVRSPAAAAAGGCDCFGVDVETYEQIKLELYAPRSIPRAVFNVTPAAGRVGLALLRGAWAS